MTVHYFDPSAWIKRHFQEVGSEEVNDPFRKTESAACCRLGNMSIGCWRLPPHGSRRI